MVSTEILTYAFTANIMPAIIVGLIIVSSYSRGNKKLRTGLVAAAMIAIAFMGICNAVVYWEMIGINISYYCNNIIP